MEHEQYRDLISLDFDGRLPASARAGLDAHCGVCEECRDFASGVKAASLSLKEAAVPRRSEAFVTAVMDRLPAARTESILSWRILVPVFAASFAAVLAVWTPALSNAFSGPESIVTASLDEPGLEIWGEAQ